MHDNNYGLTLFTCLKQMELLPAVNIVSTAPKLPCPGHQNNEQFENTRRAAVSLLIDTKLQYTEQSSYRERLLVRLLQTTAALVKSVALKALAIATATATGQQWATKTLDTAFSAALHFKTQCSITKKKSKDPNIF
jgi:hypothetical protein